MNIEVVNNNGLEVSTEEIKQLSSFVLKKYKVDSDINVIIVDDNKIKKLNKEYRDKDKITDILSFDGDGELLGEIFINYKQIERQFKKYNSSFKEEFNFILIHGILHLLGFNDEKEGERERMIIIGNKILKDFSNVFHI